MSSCLNVRDRKVDGVTRSDSNKEMRHADGFLTSADPAYKTGKPIGNVDVLIGNESYNEYTANDKLMYNAFPFLFVTGKTLPSFSSLSAKFIRHMLR